VALRLLGFSCGICLAFAPTVPGGVYRIGSLACSLASFDPFFRGRQSERFLFANVGGICRTVYMGRVDGLVGGSRIRLTVIGMLVLVSGGSVEAHGKAATWRMCLTILQASSTQTATRC
jgi:hypothetical protein